jgi:hypothetical protein
MHEPENPGGRGRFVRSYRSRPPARAFDSYRVALEVFAETDYRGRGLPVNGVGHECGDVICG